MALIFLLLLPPPPPPLPATLTPLCVSLFFYYATAAAYQFVASSRFRCVSLSIQPRPRPSPSPSPSQWAKTFGLRLRESDSKPGPDIGNLHAKFDIRNNNSLATPCPSWLLLPAPACHDIFSSGQLSLKPLRFGRV